MGAAINLTARVSVGLMFLLGAVVKVQEPARLIGTLSDAGIVFPAQVAGFVGWMELLCGVALVAGLFTRVSATLLAGTMTVALVTVTGPPLVASSTSVWELLSHLFYSPEWLLLIILIAVAIHGPVKFSVDHLLAPAYAHLRGAIHPLSSTAFLRMRSSPTPDQPLQ
ncbi:DoxX family protein [Plantibacter sp. RU18]|uniref:DoxX family protein n=1 Tax=Plantibacter sp. RU18 TaxID=3158143 RepID=UPI003D35A170